MIAEEFREIFKDILGKPVDTMEERITYLTAESDDKILSQERWEISIKVIKNNKTPEEDPIMADLLKKGGQNLTQEVWKTEKIGNGTYH